MLKRGLKVAPTSSERANKNVMNLRNMTPAGVNNLSECVNTEVVRLKRKRVKQKQQNRIRRQYWCDFPKDGRGVDASKIELLWENLVQRTLPRCGWTFPGILWYSAITNLYLVENIKILYTVTHNLWMRVTIVLKAACTSAAEQVDTMGWAWSWSNSATYFRVTWENWVNMKVAIQNKA